MCRSRVARFVFQLHQKNVRIRDVDHAARLNIVQELHHKSRRLRQLQAAERPKHRQKPHRLQGRYGEVLEAVQMSVSVELCREPHRKRGGVPVVHHCKSEPVEVFGLLRDQRRNFELGL